MMDQRANLQRIAIDAPVILDSVPCNVCQHEVPTSEAVVAEAADYVVYFCGLDCYERWRNHGTVADQFGLVPPHTDHAGAGEGDNAGDAGGKP